MATVVFGCSGVSTPSSPQALTQVEQAQATSQQITNQATKIEGTVDQAKGHSKLTLDWITKSLSLLKQPEVIPPMTSAKEEATKVNVDLEAALVTIKQLKESTGVLDTQLAESTQMIAALGNSLSTLTKEKGAAIKERDEAKAKYEDAWLGGKAWRLIFWITTASILVLIAGVLLNIHTDIFVIPFRLLGRLLAPKAT